MLKTLFNVTAYCAFFSGLLLIICMIVVGLLKPEEVSGQFVFYLFLVYLFTDFVSTVLRGPRASEDDLDDLKHEVAELSERMKYVEGDSHDHGIF